MSIKVSGNIEGTKHFIINSINIDQSRRYLEAPILYVILVLIKIN